MNSALDPGGSAAATATGRRRLLSGGLALALGGAGAGGCASGTGRGPLAAPAGSAAAASAPAPTPGSDTQAASAVGPFALGVASGDPDEQGFVIWTRWLDAQADAAGRDQTLLWEVAEDDAFQRIVARGKVTALARLARSAHVEVKGLAPGRWYSYRFHAATGAVTSPAGRSRTAGASDDRSALRVAFASCQQYEQGYYGAYRAMLADQPDLVVFVGDYIYESSWGRDHVRHHGTPEPRSLDEYRERYALYKSDPDLQAMHAAAPWVLTWDDHEVQNDYAGDQAQTLEPGFHARRAAAYQAWAEHQPTRVMVAAAARMAAGEAVDWAALRIHRRVRLSPLAEFFVLDDRQYRAPQVCPKPGRGGGNVVRLDRCPEWSDPTRSLLGRAQESWLAQAFGSAPATWNLIAQQTLFAQALREAGRPEAAVSTDGWDGYPAARRRLCADVARTGLRNPVFIGGDVHANWVCDVRADFSRPDSPVIATEFCGTSITSQGPDPARHDRASAEFPWVHFADSRRRGYGLLRIDARRLICDLRVADDVRIRRPLVTTAASYVVESGRPGPQRL